MTFDNDGKKLKFEFIVAGESELLRKGEEEVRAVLWGSSAGVGKLQSSRATTFICSGPWPASYSGRCNWPALVVVTFPSCRCNWSHLSEEDRGGDEVCTRVGVP
ncbi:hypothetical protein PR202_ga16902 [Eleusine coracana subsp. coracana]|uniref:Uncharacterized protein n=1 Tax=Eleusine coracana subsp. coracana TaxID=191504 RepID=A0AAV5CMV3_ELECO|nr:hypothetical protein PR202_ga16902 [Eleusine coracana subsp. coracana]